MVVVAVAAAVVVSVVVMMAEGTLLAMDISLFVLLGSPCVTKIIVTKP